MSNVVMSGSLGAFDIPAILQAMSLSRQYTRLRLWSEVNAKTGEIRMKAGQILQAESSRLIGKDAFLAILDGSHASFSVERCEDPETFGTPLGTIASLLLSAGSRQNRPAPSEIPPDLQPIESTLTGSAIIANDPTPPVLTPSAPPPLPAKSPAPAAKVPPKPTSVPRATKKAPAHTIVRFDAVFEDRLGDYRGLQFLVLSPLGASGVQHRWARDAGASSVQDASSVVIEALTFAKQKLDPGKAPTRVSLELKDRTIVGQRLGTGEAFICGFDASLPLGVVRHICKALEPMLERFSRTDRNRSRLAG